ncbi:DUF1801 domain-containing protein [candidate division GN15 bacterium]|nr:DUF1801 domain-containing protein [candidate division GN15 bacterium]
MSENKTKPTNRGVKTFIKSVDDAQKRADCEALLDLMQEATGEKPRMWGDSLIGFGDYHYKYDSGREGDWFVAGFSPRKANISIYLMCGLDHVAEQLERLGKHKRGKGCLYIKRLEDIDQKVLASIIKKSAAYLKKRYPS